MKVSKIALLAAMAFTASVFAQDGESVSSSNEGFNSAASSYSAPTANGAKGINFRVSGDMTLNPGWEIDNEWEKPDGGKKESSKSKAFNMQYGWNANLGLDFNDNFSMDFRLSNPEGYALGQLNFANGSAKDYIPHLPHAYFTWKTGGVFSMQGGLLNVAGNTVLDLVAGYESGTGLWTSNWGWDSEYNASQAGLRFIFDITDNFGINFTTALVSSENTLDFSPEDHNEFRFILDMNIGINDMITISPIIATRSFWHAYDEYNDDGDATSKTSVLFTYGVDADFAFSDAFNLNAGLAMGNVRISEDGTMFGFLMKAFPSFAFGINEVALNYSLGIGSYKDTYEDWDGEETEEKTIMTFNDLGLKWLFRMNDNIAFGPAAAFAFASVKDDYDNKQGLNHIRFGLDFIASF